MEQDLDLMLKNDPFCFLLILQSWQVSKVNLVGIIDVLSTTVILSEPFTICHLIYPLEICIFLDEYPHKKLL